MAAAALSRSAESRTMTTTRPPRAAPRRGPWHGDPHARARSSSWGTGDSAWGHAWGPPNWGAGGAGPLPSPRGCRLPLPYLGGSEEGDSGDLGVGTQRLAQLRGSHQDVEGPGGQRRPLPAELGQQQQRQRRGRGAQHHGPVPCGDTPKGAGTPRGEPPTPPSTPLSPPSRTHPWPGAAPASRAAPAASRDPAGARPPPLGGHAGASGDAGREQGTLWGRGTLTQGAPALQAGGAELGPPRGHPEQPQRQVQVGSEGPAERAPPGHGQQGPHCPPVVTCQDGGQPGGGTGDAAGQGGHGGDIEDGGGTRGGLGHSGSPGVTRGHLGSHWHRRRREQGRVKGHPRCAEKVTRGH